MIGNLTWDEISEGECGDCVRNGPTHGVAHARPPSNKIQYVWVPKTT